MNIHRGELLKNKSGLSRVVFCNSMGISDNTLTSWYNTPELGFRKTANSGTDCVSRLFRKKFRN